MKKVIIAAAIILTSGITAYSLNKKADKSAEPKFRTESAQFSSKSSTSHKSDLGSAD